MLLKTIAEKSILQFSWDLNIPFHIWCKNTKNICVERIVKTLPQYANGAFAYTDQIFYYLCPFKNLEYNASKKNSIVRKALA